VEDISFLFEIEIGIKIIFIENRKSTGPYKLIAFNPHAIIMLEHVTSIAIFQ
jgi:hypothetical protein